MCRYVCVFTWCAKSVYCACSTHAKCEPLTESGHTRGPLLVLSSDSDSSFLKIQDLAIKLWAKLESALGIEIISRIILYMNKSHLLVKITYILVSTSDAKWWPFKYWWYNLTVKCVKKFKSALGEVTFVCVYVFISVCKVCVCVYLSASVYLPACLCVCLNIYLCFPLHEYLCLSAYVCTYLYVYGHMCACVYTCVCVRVYVCVYYVSPRAQQEGCPGCSLIPLRYCQCRRKPEP